MIGRIEQLRQLCWRSAGVDRDAAALRGALAEIQREQAQLGAEELLQELLQQDPEQAQVLSDGSRRDLNLLLDLHHRLRTSQLMLEACLFRRESRGGHFRRDAPTRLPYWRHHSRQIKTRGVHTRAVRP